MDANKMAINELQKRIGYLEKDLPTVKAKFDLAPIESTRWSPDELLLMHFKIDAYRRAIDCINNRGLDSTIQESTRSLIRLSQNVLKGNRSEQLELVAVSASLEYLIEIQEYARSEKAEKAIDGFAPAQLIAKRLEEVKSSQMVVRKRFNDRYTVDRCNKEAKEKNLGVTVRAITKKNPWKNYTSGYLITDKHGSSHRWNDLASLYMNCIEEGRAIDGFARW